MPALDSSGLPPAEPPDPASERHNARLGLVLFAVYLAGYVAFVLVNAAFPAVMDRVTAGGVNAAVASGFALIAGAVVLAVVYALLCRTPAGGGRA